MARRGRLRSDAGNAALELVVIAPVIVALICLVIAIGRTATAQTAVDAAAQDAARQASLASSPSAARAAALSSARSALRKDGLRCRPDVRLTLAGFNVPPGKPASVRAMVTCTVRLSDITIPGMPGSRTLRARFSSPLDIYRER